MEELAECGNAGPISCTSFIFNFLICQKIRDPAIYFNLDYGQLPIGGQYLQNYFHRHLLTSVAENIGGVYEKYFFLNPATL